MKTPERPETYSPWTFLEFVLRYEDHLLVRELTQEVDPITQQKIDTWALVPMTELSPRRYRYWAERWFLDRTTLILTAEDWAVWEERQRSRESPF